MICPACTGDMVVVEYQQIELDFCPKCHGIWFDSGELGFMLEKSGINGASIGDPTHLTPAKTDEKIRKCPLCRRPMSKNYIGDHPAVMIDVCRNREGLFFDGGEVRALLEQLPHGDAEKSGAQHTTLDFLNEVFKQNS